MTEAEANHLIREQAIWGNQLATWRKEMNHADAFYNRGRAYVRQEQYEAALADFSEAIRLNPAYAEAFYNIARVFTLQKQVEAVLSPLRRALELAPEKNLVILSTDSDFDPIRDDPRFKALLAEFASQSNSPNLDDELGGG